MGLIRGTDGPQLVCSAVENGREIGCVVIDSTIGGRALGGVRMHPDVDADEVGGLARTMTLKFGFLGLPQGGAKAGVRGDPEAPDEVRWERLAAFGRAITPLLRAGIFTPSTDMGTEAADIQRMLEAAGMRVGLRDRQRTDSSYYTARTVFCGAKQATKHVGMSLTECRVAIEGFGAVGSKLAAFLAEAGAQVVAISTVRGAIYNPEGLDVGRLMALVNRHGCNIVTQYGGASRIALDELIELPVDLLCPCARPNSIHARNAGRVEARIVCPSANNPVTPAAERELARRGVLSLPDFVVNCGGVLGGTMEFASLRRDRIDKFIADDLGRRIARILDDAGRTGQSPWEVALPLALGRFQDVKEQAEHPTALHRLLHVSLALYRAGFVPGPLVAALAMPYFQRTLA